MPWMGCVFGGLGGWRFGRFADWAVGSFGGWRFRWLAVSVVGGFGGWQFGRLAIWVVCGLRLVVYGLRLADGG